MLIQEKDQPNKVQKEKKLPSLGVLLNSIQGTKKLFVVDKDFQAISDDDNHYIFKPVVKTEEPLLITENEYSKIIVGDGQPLTMKIIKALASKFSLIPVDDVEKTPDHLDFCPTLGRLSAYCPNANPLVY